VSPRPAPAPTLDVDRPAALAVRAQALGLTRSAQTAADVPGLALGVQDSPPGTARLAFSARVDGAGAVAAGWDADPRLTVAWSLRGAPHVHRLDDLAALAGALWPHDDADAAARLAWNASRVRESGVLPLEAVRLTAEAVADVAALPAQDLDWTGLTPVETPDGEPGLSKGVLSREVTRRLPQLGRWCEPCRTEHLSEQLLRLATLPGGLVAVAGGPVVFAPLPGWSGVPKAPAGTADLVREYVRRYPPATPAAVKAFLGCTPAVAKAHWPADAVPVTVAGRPGWALPESLDALTAPPPPPDVRLLPPNDAFLKAGDRDVLVPDRGEQKAIWRILGSPGALLVDALPAGIWRARTSGRKLSVTVEPFAPLPAGRRRALAAEAERMADVRGLVLDALTGG
jgi:hypothetical protein